jgi:hypothetical protein
MGLGQTNVAGSSQITNTYALGDCSFNQSQTDEQVPPTGRILLANPKMKKNKLCDAIGKGYDGTFQTLTIVHRSGREGIITQPRPTRA